MGELNWQNRTPEESRAYSWLLNGHAAVGGTWQIVPGVSMDSEHATVSEGIDGVTVKVGGGFVTPVRPPEFALIKAMQPLSVVKRFPAAVCGAG